MILKMHFLSLLVVLMASFAVGNIFVGDLPHETRYKDCGSTAKINSLVVNPCPNLPCQFPRGKTASINILFTPTEPANDVTTVVEGGIAGLWVPFPLKKCVEACDLKNCGLQCPLVPQKEYNYTVSIQVSEGYPTIKVIAKLELLDENKSNIVCVEISAKIV